MQIDYKNTTIREKKEGKWWRDVKHRIHRDFCETAEREGLFISTLSQSLGCLQGAGEREEL